MARSFAIAGVAAARPDGLLRVPFQATEHEPFFGVCRKARVRSRAPEARATAGSLSFVQVSK